ncbi:hypothetical protein JCGZ_11697 [Jatropha curcas]|uniref:Uncharacterized protein n=1 Tax=Jatropha curcas TaxID=180498 RepID=A0A067K525_JATCU|nr:hypothetical protein JCGZ_11697 [Jatropha curcas]
MGEAWKQRDLPASLHIPGEKEKPMTPPAHAMKPIFRMSPRHNGSTLYDSFELRAVTNQLNKAIQSLNCSSPTLMSYLKSPFYGQRLDSIYKENAKTPKKIMGSQLARRSIDKRASRTAGGGLMSRLWKKVKQGLLWSKQRNDN